MDEPGSSEWPVVEMDGDCEDKEMDEDSLEVALMNQVPLEILAKIFSHFDLPTRGYASMVRLSFYFIKLLSHIGLSKVEVSPPVAEMSHGKCGCPEYF